VGRPDVLVQSFPPATCPPPGRVLLVVDSLGEGGAERYVRELAIALRHRGWPVEVSCSTGGVGESALAEAGVPTFPLLDDLVTRRASPGYAGALRRLVQERRPAVVHAHRYASAVAATAALRDTAVPLVVTEHTEAPWRNARARTVSRLVYRRADHVVAVSSAVRDLLVADYQVRPERVEMLLPATVVADRPIAPRRLVTSDGPVVGVVGRLVPEQGIDVFLRAATLVSAVVPAARFVVLGEGMLRSELERRAGALGLGDSVLFTGHRTDAANVIAGLDVLVVPSRSDGSPFCVAEAMAAGVPVVASSVGGLPDLVEHGGSGLLVAPEDPEGLARALVSLAMDPLGAREMGRRGRQLAAARTHTGLTDRMAELYTAVAGRAAMLR